MATSDSYIRYVQREGFSQGNLDLLFEDISPDIEIRARRCWSQMGFTTRRREFVRAYKEGRAAFDKAGHARVPNPYTSFEAVLQVA